VTVGEGLLDIHMHDVESIVLRVDRRTVSIIRETIKLT
jgi:hypothetical protein